MVREGVSPGQTTEGEAEETRAGSEFEDVEVGERRDEEEDGREVPGQVVAESQHGGEGGGRLAWARREWAVEIVRRESGRKCSARHTA